MTNTMTPTEMLTRLEEAIMADKLSSFYYNDLVVSWFQSVNGVKGILVHHVTFAKFIPADEINFTLLRVMKELPAVEWQTLI